MPDEVRQISITVQATQAINSLIRMGSALDGVQSLVGKTDQQLRKAEGVIQRTAVASRNAANTIGQLKAALTAANAATRAAEQQNQRLVASLQRAGQQLDNVRTKVTAQTGVLQTLRQANRQAEAQISSQLSVIKRQGREYQDLATKTATATAAQRAFNQAQKAGLASQFAKAQPLRTNFQGGITPNGTVPLRDISAQTVTNVARTATALSDVEKRAAAAKSQLDKFNSAGVPNALRYQLYDIVALFGIAGIAATGLAVSFNNVGIQWEKNFANVIRTSQVTGTAVEFLKEQFLELQTLVPVTSQDLATIGTLGAQMGVAASSLATFTTITAKFSATAGIGVDEAATALSRLDELLPDVRGNYERLASTILKTGVNAVATEQQIVRGVGQIASIGRVAGLTTPQIVGLASALSSLGFSPELQRSVVTSSFSRILSATAQVTAQTEKFGAVLHMTGAEFKQAWQEDAIGTYERLLKAIASRGDAVSVLQGLGLASQRLTPNLLKLGQNTSVLDETLRDTAIGWKENTELSRQYGIIANTVAARIQVMSQTWEALLVTLGETEGIKVAVDAITEFLKALRTLAKVPGLSTVVTVGSIITGLIGVFFLAASALAVLTAGYIAMFNANLGLRAALASEAAAEEAAAVAAAHRTTIIGAEVIATNTLTGATVANSEALVVNGVAGGTAAVGMGKAGTAALAVSSRLLTSLPAIFSWTAAITAGILAVVGFYTALATAPTWRFDLEKTFAGVDTLPETLDFDVKKIKEFQQTLDDFDPGTKKAREGLQELAGNFGIKPNANLAAMWTDLSDAILELGNSEDQLAAINQVADEFGLTTEDLLRRMPDLSKAIGSNVAVLADEQEEMLKLADATSLWAGILGSTEENVTNLKDAVKGGASSFLDFGETLTNAFDKDLKNGEGFGSFIDNMNKQIADFEGFSQNLGALVQKGGVQLATLFASQGPVAAQALTDALNLTPDQIAQIENQMSLAAFYASDAFANSFAQNNAILASVFQQTGSTQAVAEFNAAFNDALRNQTTIDPGVLAALQTKFGIKLDASIIPDLDPKDFEYAIAAAGARITPITVPVTTSVGQGDFTATREVEAWVVEMEGKTLVMDTDPNTDAGRAKIAVWRAEENNKPLTMRLGLNTNAAQASLNAFKAQNLNLVAYIRRVDGGATGGLMQANGKFTNRAPGFAGGTVFRGPGTGTSDSILARVSAGEAITRARAVKYYGAQFFDDLNRMRIPRFAQGGMVNPPTSATGGAAVVSYVNINNPVTRDPIKDLRENAQNAVAGVWA